MADFGVLIDMFWMLVTWLVKNFASTSKISRQHKFIKWWHKSATRLMLATKGWILGNNTMSRRRQGAPKIYFGPMYFGPKYIFCHRHLKLVSKITFRWSDFTCTKAFIWNNKIWIYQTIQTEVQKLESTRIKRGFQYSWCLNELVVREEIVLKFQTSVVALK